MKTHTVNLTSDELDTLAVAMDCLIDSFDNDADESVNDAKRLRDLMYEQLHKAMKEEGLL